MKDCPVCERPGLVDEMDRCPQCGADLECFALLDGLREGENTGKLSPQGSGGLKIKWLMSASLSVVLIGLVLTSAYLGMRIDRLTDQFDQQFDQHMARLTDRLTALTTVSGYRESTHRIKAMERRFEGFEKNRDWSIDGLPNRMPSPVVDRKPSSDNGVIVERVAVKATSRASENPIARQTDSKFAAQIVNFDRQRIVVSERIKAALAKYNAPTLINSQPGTVAYGQNKPATGVFIAR
ncbi:MAG: hypothetical protein KJO08_02425 [Gammaproteobacteria bacterium]|nr:hypothetical protein [Gammaproteobacteria bacterium]NNJ83331.1 hypothetical protein [Gammaproteobacteria bacterium]